MLRIYKWMGFGFGFGFGIGMEISGCTDSMSITYGADTELSIMTDCGQYAKKRGRVPSRENCMALCMSEKDFPCR